MVNGSSRFMRVAKLIFFDVMGTLFIETFTPSGSGNYFSSIVMDVETKIVRNYLKSHVVKE